MLTQPIKYIHRQGFGKSVAHDEIQHYLKKQIPEIELEKKIGARRSDAVWESRKIVFEIQLSSLSNDQAAVRSSDYKRAGYHVVWILHEKNFNGPNVSSAERFLRLNYPTYYTNGSLFYDQMEVVEGSRRRFRGDPLPIQLTSPCIPFLKIPGRHWPLQFVGDLHTWCSLHSVSALRGIFKKHQSPQGLRWWLQWIGFRILEGVSKNTK